MTQEQQQFIKDVRDLMAQRPNYFTTIPEFVEKMMERGVTRYTKSGDEMSREDAKTAILRTFYNESQRNALGMIKMIPDEHTSEWLIPNDRVETAIVYELEKQARRKARLAQTLRQKANRVQR